MLIRPRSETSIEEVRTLSHLSNNGRFRIDTLAALGKTIVKESHGGYIYTQGKGLIDNSLSLKIDLEQKSIISVENIHRGGIYAFGQETSTWYNDPQKSYDFDGKMTIFRPFLSDGQHFDYIPEIFEEDFDMAFETTLGSILVYVSFAQLFFPVSFDLIIDSHMGWNIVNTTLSKHPYFKIYSICEVQEYLQHVDRLMSILRSSANKPYRVFIAIRPFEIHVQFLHFDKKMNLTLNSIDHCHLLELYNTRRSLSTIEVDAALLTVPYLTREVVI